MVHASLNPSVAQLSEDAKAVAPQLKSVVTVSSASATDIATDFGVTPEAISVMHLGVDTEMFRPLPAITREPYRLMTTASADAPLKVCRIC